MCAEIKKWDRSSIWETKANIISFITYKMVCSHFILNILVFVNELNHLSLKLKLSKKKVLFFIMVFFKYGHVDTNIWNRLIAKALFLLHSLNVTYMQWWKSVCSLSQPKKNETEHCLFTSIIYHIITKISTTGKM
jgi:hypothetical protein